MSGIATKWLCPKYFFFLMLGFQSFFLLFCFVNLDCWYDILISSSTWLFVCFLGFFILLTSSLLSLDVYQKTYPKFLIHLFEYFEYFYFRKHMLSRLLSFTWTSQLFGYSGLGLHISLGVSAIPSGKGYWERTQGPLHSQQSAGFQESGGKEPWGREHRTSQLISPICCHPTRYLNLLSP